jgi:hypothetical protein
MGRRLVQWSLMSLGLLMAANLSAATLQVDGTGQLTGATGVDVGGTLYDVVFLDGTCAALFSGCDAVADFPFSTEANGRLAAQALLDQVFIGPFDVFDFPPIPVVFGCFTDLSCTALTPFGFSPGILSAAASNHTVEALDLVFINESNPAFDTSSFGNSVWASWALSSSAPVPAPSTLGLLGAAGLAALLARRKR